MGRIARAGPLPYGSVSRRRLFVVAVAGVQLPVTLLVGFAVNSGVAPAPVAGLAGSWCTRIRGPLLPPWRR